MSEARYLSLVVLFCRRMGLLVFHAYDGFRVTEPGFVDLVICGPHGVIFAELKVKGGLLRVAQARWRRGLKAAGADYRVYTEDDWYCGKVQRDLELLAGETPLAA